MIGKGSFGKVLLARHRADDEFYAVKVLQKKAILKKKEVNTHADMPSFETTNIQKYTDNMTRHLCDLSNPPALCIPQEKHIMSERNVLLKNVKHPFLVGLHYSFQTADKLYFILDYINGGEVSYWLLNCCQQEIRI